MLYIHKNIFLLGVFIFDFFAKEYQKKVKEYLLQSISQKGIILAIKYIMRRYLTYENARFGQELLSYDQSVE